MSNFKENYKGGQNVKRVGNPPRSFLAQASPPMHNKYPNNWQHFFELYNLVEYYYVSPFVQKEAIEIVVKGLISQVQSQESLLKKLTIFIAEIS